MAAELSHLRLTKKQQITKAQNPSQVNWRTSMRINHHNSRLVLGLVAAGVGLLSAQLSFAQTGPRDLAAQRFVLDDGTGSGFWLTLQVPVLTGDVTLNFPTALGTAYFILSNSVAGQTINGPLTLDGGTNLTLTNPLRAIDGGTGFDTYTTGDLLFANSATTLQQLGIGTAGQMLISNGATPNWSNSPTIIGGTIDNTPIGGTTPSTGTFTDLVVNGTTTLGNGVGVDNVTVNTNNGNLQLTVGGGNFSLSNSTGLNVATDGTLNDATGDFTINDALTQTGGGQVTFSGNVDANNGLDVSGANLTVGGTNFVVDVASGNVSTSGTLTVTSTTTLNGNTFIGNGNDDVSINTGTGNFSVSNGTGLNVATNGVLSDASGSLTVNDNFVVTGTSDLQGVVSNSTGTLTIGDDLSVTGNTTLGDAASDAITMNGAFDANDQGNVIGNNANAQQLLIDGVIGGTAELQLDGDADIDGNLNVDGSVTAGSLTLNGNLDMNQNDVVDLGDISFSQAGSNITNTAGNINMADNVVPTVDNSFSLGTDGLRWSEAYVAGTSVHIGPTGGEAANTEMNLGYAGGTTGSINVNAGTAEISITTGATDIANNLNANSGVDVTGADLTVGGANFTVTVGSGNTAVGGTLTVTGATNLNGAANIGNGNDNVNINAGTGTFQLSSSELNVTAAGDISDLGGAVTIADALSQTGAGQVTFSGNVDAQNGLDVTTANLTVGGANFTVAPGTGNVTTAGTLQVDAATTLGNGTATDVVTVNTGGGTNLTISESTLDRNSGATETVAIDNGGAGDVNLLVNGATSTTNSRLTVRNGHWTSQQGTAPTTGANAAGVATSVLTNATDVAGLLNITTNAGGQAAGAQTTVSFNTAYGTAPIVVLSAANTNAPGINAHVSRTTTGFTVNFVGTPAASTSYQFFYQVIETQ